jgi:prolipoprotein diacylglyceryltransferase
MLVHLGLALWLCRRGKVRLRIGAGLGFCYFWGMSCGAKILYDILHHRLDWRNYLDIHYYFETGAWGGPLAYLAVAVGAIVLFARNKRRLMDIAVLALPVPMILAKVSCFLNGCCYGRESGLPWAVAFVEGAKAPAGIARHPTQLYEIAVLAVILLVFAVLDRERWRGTLLYWFVAIYGLGRPLTEFFRDSEAHDPLLGPLSASQFVCGAAAVVCVIALAAFSRHWSAVRRGTGLGVSG